MRLSINIFSLFYLSVVLFVRSFVRSFVRWFVRILLFTCSLVVVIPLSLGAQNIVVAAVASTFTTLDPYDANDALSLAVVKSFYEGLFGIDNNMKIKPVLATSYEVSKDGLAYTINLRKGVKFHDGTDFNAQAVKVNLERAINPESRLKRSSLFNSVARIEVLDEHRVRIVLHEPYSAFINVLAHPAAVMISPAALNKYGNKQIGFNPVGTGPFIFEHWSATDSLRVKKFDGYYKKGLPKVDGMVFKPVVENNTRAAMIQTGEAHFAFTIPYEQAKILEKNPNLTLVRAPSITERYIAFNVLQSPFNDVRVRQAINYAINKEALIKVAFAGYATPATGVLPPGIEFSKNYGAWAYDPVKARELLKEAGYPNGFASTLWSSHNSTTAQKVISFVQQQLSQVGINVSLEALETGQRVSRIEGAKDPMKSDLRMFYVGWSASTADVNFALTPLLATQSWPPKMFNIGYYSNPKVDLLLKDALKTTDKEQKKKIYEEAQDLIMADVPWAFLVVDELLYVHSKKLKGMYVIMDTSFNFEEVELIK